MSAGRESIGGFSRRGSSSSAGPATLVDKGTWAASTVYAPGSVVTRSGTRYVTWLGATAQTSFVTTDWVALGVTSDTF